MADWYKTHGASPDCYPESEYLEWAQDQGLYVDAAGNVDYGPPEPVRDSDRYFDIPDEDMVIADDTATGGLDTWDF